MPKKHEKDKFSMTVCGEFFPEIYPAFRSYNWSRGKEDPLSTEMRLFCACMRWSFNRLSEGASRDEIKKRGQELFGLNSRYADDARLKAQALLDSQRELLELEIEETEKKLDRARQKLGMTMRKLAKAEEKGAIPEVVEKLRLAVKGRNNRVASLEKRLAESWRPTGRTGPYPRWCLAEESSGKEFAKAGPHGKSGGLPAKTASTPGETKLKAATRI